MSEREIGRTARNLLYHSLQKNISQTFTEKTGELKRKTFAKSYFNKDAQLTSLVLSGPKHLFVQNYGFEGVKKNSINMRLKATEIVEKALASSKVIDFLADEVSKVRAEEIVLEFRK